MKKFLPVLLISSFYFLISGFQPGPALAAEDCPEGPWYEQTPCQFSKKVKNSSNPEEIFGERYTYAQINWIFNSLATIVAPDLSDKEDLEEFIKKLVIGQQSPSLKDYAQLGLPGLLLGGISETMTHPPASGIQYLAQTSSKFQIVPSVHAQGYGFKALQPTVQYLWSATRNMSYLIMVILLVASGFLIMFRVKINPQTVVSLQTMVPKLIITMLLVTFSFAIAGLIIDLIYIVIAAFVALLAPPIGNVIQPSNLGATIAWFTTSNYGWVVSYFILPWILFFILGWGMGLVTFGFVTGITSIISFIAIIFLAWNLFKIWWMLVKAQLTLIFLIALGPLQIMLDLIPGQSGFGSWIRNIIANASVFATVPIMFLLNMLFWRPFFGLGDNLPTDWGWLQEILRVVGLNPLGTISTGISGTASLPNLPLVNGMGFMFNFVAGYVILAMTPKIADIIRDALKVPAFKYGNALGEALWNPMTKFGAQYGTNWIGDRAKTWGDFSRMPAWEKAAYVASQVAKSSGQVK
ncbi:MAG: hypothetical protein AAB768_00030 [Patescibacteria group bacterium]